MSNRGRITPKRNTQQKIRRILATTGARGTQRQGTKGLQVVAAQLVSK